MSDVAATTAPHIPVLIGPLIEHVAPVSGAWIDGTFGAGGYARALAEAGADSVLGIDRDPLAHEMAAKWLDQYGGKIRTAEGTFSEMDEIAGAPVDGVVLDLGVSSMQLDQAERGFSFLRDGPLDMRMSQSGPSAADLVNTVSEEALADILYHYGEERASRRIARQIVKTARPRRLMKPPPSLVETVEKCLPRPKPGQSHPATRSFQAIRIAVNDEFGQLAEGLEAAERALKPGGKLAVVTFHSLEDRVSNAFCTLPRHRRGGSRYAPEAETLTPRFTLTPRRAIGPDADELAMNPRSRSARLRVATRTDAPAIPTDRTQLGLPAPHFMS